MLADMVADKVTDMLAPMVADKVADMVAVMKVDKVALHGHLCGSHKECQRVQKSARSRGQEGP